MKVIVALQVLSYLGSTLARPMVQSSSPGELCSDSFKDSIYVRPENTKEDPSVGHVGYPAQTACNGTYIFYFSTTGWPKAYPVSGEIEVPKVKLSKRKSSWINKRSWETKIELNEDVPLDDFSIDAWLYKSPGGYTGTLVNWVLKRLPSDDDDEPTPPKPPVKKPEDPKKGKGTLDSNIEMAAATKVPDFASTPESAAVLDADKHHNNYKVLFEQF